MLTIRCGGPAIGIGIERHVGVPRPDTIKKLNMGLDPVQGYLPPDGYDP